MAAAAAAATAAGEAGRRGCNLASGPGTSMCLGGGAERRWGGMPWATLQRGTRRTRLPKPIKEATPSVNPNVTWGLWVFRMFDFSENLKVP